MKAKGCKKLKPSVRIRIMILFCNGNLKAYNYVIHHFLELEVFNGDNDIGDIIEETLPKYLYREQYQKGNP